MVKFQEILSEWGASKNIEELGHCEGEGGDYLNLLYIIFKITHLKTKKAVSNENSTVKAYQYFTQILP